MHFVLAAPVEVMRYALDELCIEQWSASRDVADLEARLHGTTDISVSKNAIVVALTAEVLIFLLHVLSCCAHFSWLTCLCQCCFAANLLPGYFVHVNCLTFMLFSR
jgi:hypothetical protein